jgi:hypothetical protein
MKPELAYLVNIRELDDNARQKILSMSGTYVRCYKCDSLFHIMKNCRLYALKRQQK